MCWPWPARRASIPWILVVGLLLSITLMGVAATWIAKLLHRFRWIGYVGLVDRPLRRPAHDLGGRARRWSSIWARPRAYNARHARRRWTSSRPKRPREAARPSLGRLRRRLRAAEAFAPFGDLGVLDLAEQHLGRLRPRGRAAGCRAPPRRRGSASGRGSSRPPTSAMVSAANGMKGSATLANRATRFRPVRTATAARSGSVLSAVQGAASVR